MESQRPPLVETKNVKEVKSAVRKTIQESGFLAIMAEVGSGKTTLYNHLCEFWATKPHDFAVVEIKSFKQIQSRIPIIMKLLINKIDPEMHVPGDAESRYHALTQALRYAHRSGRHVILIVDEAQDMNLQTLRDLKKIHEIDGFGKDHLFSIILLGKIHRQWDRIAELPELGYRIRRVLLDTLTNAEIILFAEQRFSVKFKDEKTSQRFAGMVNVRTPLGVGHVADAVRWHRGMEDGEKILITMDDLRSLPVISRAFRIEQAGVTNKEIVEAAKEIDPNLKVHPQRVSEFKQGKMPTDHAMYATLDAATNLCISGRLAQREGLVKEAK